MEGTIVNALDITPASFNTFFSENIEPGQAEVDLIEHAATHLALLASYLKARKRGYNHNGAVYQANKVRAKIRRALGHRVTRPVDF